MTRAQRTWHARIWCALGPMLIVGVIGALLARGSRAGVAAALDASRTDDSAAASRSFGAEARP